MTLLNRVAQAGDDLVFYLSSQCLFDGAGIGGMTVGEHLLWRDIYRLSLLKEGVRRLPHPRVPASPLHPSAYAVLLLT